MKATYNKHLADALPGYKNAYFQPCPPPPDWFSKPLFVLLGAGSVASVGIIAVVYLYALALPITAFVGGCFVYHKLKDKLSSK